MEMVESTYVNGQVYDLVLRNNIVFHSFRYSALERAFIKGVDKIDQRDVSMFREV